jgi:PAS domain S-box-containing protein
MNTEATNTELQFLAGGGEMGELIRNKDWRKTSLGSPEFWPQSLRTALSIVLNSRFPMFIWWGPELLCFYNDAYRPSLGGEGKHPTILGLNAKEAWPEIWDIIKPLIDKVIERGESVWFEDLLVPIFRNGKIEDVYWTFSYSPIYGNSGKVEGVLVTCTETTEKVLIKKQLQESERKLRLIILQAPVSIGIFRGKHYVTEIANSKALELWGRNEKEVLGKPILDVMPELRSQGIQELLDEVYTTGKPYAALELPVQIMKNGKLETLYINFNYDAVYDDQGKIVGIMTVGIDVTEQVLAHKKIEANEEKLNIVIEASDLGTWELNFQSGEIAYSKRYLDILGLKGDNFSHADLLKRIHPGDLGARQKAMEQALLTGYLHYQARAVWDDGSIHWFEGKGKLFYNKENKPLRMMGTLRDMTEEKNQQQSIEESEERFRNFVTQSPIPTVIFRGPDHIIEIANSVMLKRWNKTPEELLNKKFIDVFPAMNDQRIPALLDEVYRTGKTYKEDESISYIQMHGSSQVSYVDFEYSPLFEPDGKISGIIATVTDVTERVEARNKIRESEQRFRNLIMQSPVAKAILKGRDHIVEIANDVMLKNIWRKEEQEVVGKKISDVFPELIKQKHIELLDKVFNTAEKWTASESRLTVKGNDGSKDFYLDYEYAPLIEADETVSGIKLTAIDVSEKVEARKKVEDSENELRVLSNSLELKVSERTTELEQKNIELEHMNKELQSFAYISSHDLQEPLRKIQTFSTRIHDKEYDSLSDHGKDLFKRMQLSAERMQTLINDLLAYSRTNSAEKKYEKVNLSKIIEEVMEDLKEEIKEKNAIIEVANMGELAIIPFQMRQLIQNLLSNSLKFSKSDRPPRIKINSEIKPGAKLSHEKLDPAKQYCHISFSDNGIGFEQQYNERIFELFQRLNGKNEFPGTGIGLAIVKKIVENHNGIITAAGELNKGATFDIFIPII